MKSNKALINTLLNLKQNSLLLFFLMSFICTRCEKENSYNNDIETCSLTICFDTYSKTKSDLIPENIVDVNLLIFDQNQELIKSVFLNNETSTTLKISYGIKTIAAIANVGNKDFSQCSTLAHLRNYKQNSMIGTGGNTVFCGEVTENLTQSNKYITIPLTRMVSKITYLFDKSNLNGDINLTIQKIQLKNTPIECNYFTSNTPNSSQITAIGDALEGPNLEPADHNSATPLYVFENMQGTIGTNSNPISKHPGSKENVCTYVEITANYSSSTKTGTVKYKNFLGLNSTNNFDIIRGKHYKETIIFNGTSIDENSWRVDVSDLHDIPSAKINVTGISLDYNLLKLNNGDSHQLYATIYPANATNKECIWSSSNSSVVSVNPTSGKLTTHNYGTAVITVKSVDGQFIDYCTVNVYDLITLEVGTHELPVYDYNTDEMISCTVIIYLRANLNRPSDMSIIQAIAQDVSVNIIYSYIKDGITYSRNRTVTLDTNQNNDYLHNGIGGETEIIYLDYLSTEAQLLAAINSISIEVIPSSLYIQNWHVAW